MKVTLEIDLEPHLTAGEIEAYRKLCEKDTVLPEAGIAGLIRREIKSAPKTPRRREVAPV